MFLPEIDRDTIAKYLELEREAGTGRFATDCIEQLQKENGQIWEIMKLMAIAVGEPREVAHVISYVLMTYKLLRIQAEDDLLSRLFKDDTKD